MRELGCSVHLRFTKYRAGISKLTMIIYELLTDDTTANVIRVILIGRLKRLSSSTSSN